MDKIIFNPEGHIYYRESDGMQLMSVSHFRKLFEKTNWDHNVKKSAAQKYFSPKRYKELKDAWEADGTRHILEPAFIDYLMPYMDADTFERCCKEVRAEWDAKGALWSQIGSEAHAKEEKEAIDKGYSINPYTGKKYKTQILNKRGDGWNETTVEKLSELKPGFYPEVMVWHMFPVPVFSQSMQKDICGICGTLDRLYKDPNACFIRDYKFTEKPIEDFGITYKNLGKERHTYPWDSYYVTKLSGYKLQLNTYGFMCEEHGIPPKKLYVDNHGNSISIDYRPELVNISIDKVFTESL